MSQQIISHILINSGVGGTRLPYDITQHISQFVPFKVYYLSPELMDMIIEFIPYHIKYSWNKYYYYTYHEYLKFQPYDGYIRNVIRKDMWFVLKFLKEMNINRWTKKKKFLYKKILCDSYLQMLNNWCIEHESHRCRNILNSD
jgi:hypothetical protein